MRILIILFILITTQMVSQNLTVPACGMIIKKGDIITIDTLIFDNRTTILLQDNAQLIIRERLVGGDFVRFKYGDDGSGNLSQPKDESVRLDRIDPKTGATFYDYRDSVDVNPVITFERCRPETFVYGPYVDVDLEYTPICDDTALGIKEEEYTYEELENNSCVVYNLLGQELFRGKYKNIPIIRQKVLLIKVFMKQYNTFYYQKKIIM